MKAARWALAVFSVALAALLATPPAQAAGELVQEAKVARIVCDQVARQAEQAHWMRVKNAMTRDELLWTVQIDTAGFSPMLRRLVTDSVVVGFNAGSESGARAGAIALCTGELASYR